MADVCTTPSRGQAAATRREEIDDSRVRELAQGWLLPYRCTGEAVLGSQGVIVNKATGAVLHLGSAFPIERDVALYDVGYQFDAYDLVITRVLDPERALDALGELGISVATPEYEHGAVWRVARLVERVELAACLKVLPHVFGHLGLYFTAEKLERARASGAFTCEVLGCACGCRSGTAGC